MEEEELDVAARDEAGDVVVEELVDDLEVPFAQVSASWGRASTEIIAKRW